jgi:sugar transferase (PEP-CTERM/EpsH1 system associated)
VERKKIAILLSRFPYPLDKGDKLRAFHQIRFLHAHHDIYLFALTTHSISLEEKNALLPYCKQITIYKLSIFSSFWNILISLFKNRPIQVGYFFSASVYQQWKKAILQLQPHLIYCQLSRTALYAKDLPFYKILDFQDAFSLNYKRIHQQSKGWKKIFYARESHCMKLFEKKIMTWFNKTTIISAYDKQQIENVETITVVPNGVDSQYFSPQDSSKKVDLLFLGNMNYLPNKQAVYYLLEKISPLILSKVPTLKIGIAGAGSEKFQSYRSDNIHITGWQEDIRNAYKEARIFIAPLFTGAGMQNKLLEAMSMRLPCITTSVTNVSLQADEQEHLLIANDAPAFVEKILFLLHNTEKQKQIGHNARAFICERYTWEKANMPLLALINEPNIFAG